MRLVNKEGQKSPVYVQGENLIIEVTTPRNLRALFMWITTRQTGTSNTCSPNIKEPINLLAPRSVYTVGQPDEQHMVWKPLPPFGREFITVIATKQPLVFTPRPPRYDPEPASVYLDQLRQAIPRGEALAQAEIAAAFFSIETRKTGAENP